MASFFLSPFVWTPVAAETDDSTPLNVAVREHNEKSNDLLTVDEVVRALSNWDPSEYTVSEESKPVLEEASKIFERVALARQLPPGSLFYRSINWTRSKDGLTEVKSTDLCLGIKSAPNRMDSVVIRTEPGESRPAPADGFQWKLAPSYPETSFVNNSHNFFVARNREQEVTTICCALSLNEFHSDARLVAFDGQGKRMAALGVGGEIFDGIRMEMFQFPDGTENVTLVGIEVPVAP
ncbi:hypothetical protein FYK55_28220 [Roseiconus nitratireducens]|uniref:Uncharacterized protein n=1 Tax=Roseiconus nitratireducens TaxID=2605748 RepID=A0A5M6CM00_9BACT|nr:hypothetical protein [Roseiconus nitratireducens]KAA5536083.1 hypothetical protein FYK55_28220 [Roseiconus nitratireducens]